MAANTNSTIALRAPTTLATLPKEVHVAIFAELDPISSLSLGLACPELYQTHLQITGIITIDTYFSFNDYDAWVQLRDVLDLWLGRAWVFNVVIWKYERAEDFNLVTVFVDDHAGLYYDVNDYLNMLLQ